MTGHNGAHPDTPSGHIGRRQEGTLLVGAHPFPLTGTGGARSFGAQAGRQAGRPAAGRCPYPIHPIKGHPPSGRTGRRGTSGAPSLREDPRFARTPPSGAQAGGALRGLALATSKVFDCLPAPQRVCPEWVRPWPTRPSAPPETGIPLRGTGIPVESTIWGESVLLRLKTVL